MAPHVMPCHVIITWHHITHMYVTLSTRFTMFLIRCCQQWCRCGEHSSWGHMVASLCVCLCQCLCLCRCFLLLRICRTIFINHPDRDTRLTHTHTNIHIRTLHALDKCSKQDRQTACGKKERTGTCHVNIPIISCHESVPVIVIIMCLFAPALSYLYQPPTAINNLDIMRDMWFTLSEEIWYSNQGRGRGEEICST